MANSTTLFDAGPGEVVCHRTRGSPKLREALARLAADTQFVPATGGSMARRLVDSARSRYLRWIWPLAIALLLLAGSSGCEGESQQALSPAMQTPSPASSLVPTLPVQTAGREVRSDRQRNDSPRASAGDLKALVQGNNTFALNLYGTLSKR